jgi:hypothetical protein
MRIPYNVLDGYCPNCIYCNEKIKERKPDDEGRALPNAYRCDKFVMKNGVCREFKDKKDMQMRMDEVVGK